MILPSNKSLLSGCFFMCFFIMILGCHRMCNNYIEPQGSTEQTHTNHASKNNETQDRDDAAVLLCIKRFLEANKNKIMYYVPRLYEDDVVKIDNNMLFWRKNEEAPFRTNCWNVWMNNDTLYPDP